jgi:4-amino-4-deoxy-L-arabinose transferase-like glycosyltransferase
MIPATISIKNQQYLLLLVAALMMIPFLGTTHLFDWDEINFAESSREMIVSGNFMQVSINYEPFWEKPPLFFWLQSGSMMIFGINEFAARFPNAIAGLITLAFLMFAGKRLYNEKFGLLWALLYFGSLLPQLYFRSGIIDPIFNLFIFISVYFIYNGFHSKRITDYLYAGLFSGLAVLTKGPVALLLLLLTAAIIMSIGRFKHLPGLKHILAFLLVFLVITFAWYGPETIKNGSWFIVEFINYQIDLFMTPVAGHSQPLLYHFYVVLLGCFPISILALPSIFKFKSGNSTDFEKWMRVLFWIVMIVFTLSTTKIVHYSSMAYLPLSFLATLHLWNLWERKQSIKKWHLHALMLAGLTLASAIVLITIVGVYRLKLIDFIKDTYVAEALKIDANWNLKLMSCGIILGYGVLQMHKDLKLGLVMRAAWSMAISLALTLSLTALYILPKIEAHSQGSAIHFFKSVSGEDAYIIPVGYKTYAHYFYGKISPENAVKKSDEAKYLENQTDKPVYVISKISRGDLTKEYPRLLQISSEGGYNFYKKD